MPTRRLPQTNVTRLKALSNAKERMDVTPAPQMPLTADTQAKITAQQPAYQEKFKNETTTLQAQASLTAEVSVARNLASVFIRHFIEALFNAIRRGTFANNAKAYYHLDISSDVLPSVSSDENINLWANNLADGETQRIADGGAPITFPSIAEVNAATSNFLALSLQQSLAKTTHDEAQEALNALNQEADKLILKTWNEIETAYNEGDIPSMRRKAREWGVVYVNDNGKISEDFEINPTELKNLFEFDNNELKPSTVITVINKSAMDGRGYLSTSPNIEEGTPQIAPGNSTTAWTVSNFAVDLVTHKALNIRNTSDTQVLSITVEYTP